MRAARQAGRLVAIPRRAQANKYAVLRGERERARLALSRAQGEIKNARVPHEDIIGAGIYCTALHQDDWCSVYRLIARLSLPLSVPPSLPLLAHSPPTLPLYRRRGSPF